MDTHYALELSVGDSLYINGEYGMSNSSGTVFTITGDDSDNSVFFGERATVSPLGGLPPTKALPYFASLLQKQMFSADLCVCTGSDFLQVE